MKKEISMSAEFIEELLLELKTRRDYAVKKLEDKFDLEYVGKKTAYNIAINLIRREQDKWSSESQPNDKEKPVYCVRNVKKGDGFTVNNPEKYSKIIINQGSKPDNDGWVLHDGNGMPDHIFADTIIEAFTGSKYGQQAKFYNWEIQFKYRIIELVAPKSWFGNDVPETTVTGHSKPALIEPLRVYEKTGEPYYGIRDLTDRVSELIKSNNYLLNNAKVEG